MTTRKGIISFLAGLHPRCGASSILSVMDPCIAREIITALDGKHVERVSLERVRGFISRSPAETSNPGGLGNVPDLPSEVTMTWKKGRVVRYECQSPRRAGEDLGGIPLTKYSLSAISKAAELPMDVALSHLCPSANLLRFKFAEREDASTGDLPPFGWAGESYVVDGSNWIWAFYTLIVPHSPVIVTMTAEMHWYPGAPPGQRSVTLELAGRKILEDGTVRPWYSYVVAIRVSREFEIKVAESLRSIRRTLSSVLQLMSETGSPSLPSGTPIERVVRSVLGY